MASWSRSVARYALRTVRISSFGPADQPGHTFRPSMFLSPAAVSSCSYGTSSYSRSEDTIFALASGSGRAGIAIIRVSGAMSRTLYFSLCLNKALRPYSKLPSAHKLVVRNLHHPVTGDILDAGAGVIYFPAGRSYTGQESLELHVHGGLATVTDLLEALCAQLASETKIRPAEPGEFTRRAFENNRLDLTTSEALHSLISAETSIQRKVALQGAGGLQTARYEAMRTTLLEAMAMVEALIDFGDEDGVETGTWTSARAKVQSMKTLIQSELGVASSNNSASGPTQRHVGEIVTQGIKLALYGPPNAGKSSLLNRLADRTAAIVSPIPGTTRDVLNISLDLAGYKVIVYDTAGLGHSSTDVVEQIGMERARAAVHDSDLALLVTPISQAQHEVLRPHSYTKQDPDLVFYNKTDLVPGLKSCASENGGKWYGSIKTDEGVSDLVQGLQSVVQRKYSTALANEPPLITQTRHRYHLQECLSHLLHFEQFAHRQDPDLVLTAEALRNAAQSLAKVTGSHISPDEILGSIFSTFCIGK